MNPFDKLLELGFKGTGKPVKGERSKPAAPTPKQPKSAKPAPKKKTKQPKQKPKERKSSITLVTRNGLLIAMTPADVRRQQSAIDSAKSTKRSQQITHQSRTSPKVKSIEQQVPAPRPSLDQVMDRMIADLPNRSMPELHQQWRNVIGRIAAGKGKGLGRFRDAVMAEWGRRYQLALDDPDHFDWPSTEAHLGDGTLKAGQWLNEGMLSYLGYRVGRTKGVSDTARRHILDAMFSAHCRQSTVWTMSANGRAPSTSPAASENGSRTGRICRQRKAPEVDGHV
ncbi:MAG: hypothetical protein IPP23_03310 [Sphingomonadales bacterium]|nr:hypothetical protein [Sphingomonadales bacterium]